MRKIAFLFDGQGSQHVGMGKELFEKVPGVHNFFGVAEAIRPGTLAQMLTGDEEELKKTSNTQPCLFLADIAGAIALEENGIKPDAVAGFSLGEVVALAVSGALSDKEAFKLVCKRADLMQTAAEENQGKMVAVLRMDTKDLENLCHDHGVYPVNYNCPGQVVVSGESDKIDSFTEALSEKKIRCIPLEVGGPFHTPYMRQAADSLRSELKGGKLYNINKTYIPLYANKTAEPYSENPEIIVETIADQISNSVQWEKTIRNMADEGVDTFIECGPGKALLGFVKRIVPEARMYNVCDMDTLKAVTEELKECC